MSSTVKQHHVTCTSEEETKEVGRQLGKIATSGTVVSLRGPLGAGKTIIAKGIAEALGITEAIVSPTFTLVQEYEGRLPMHHLDLYRIDGIEDFEGIGGEELLYSAGITVIEWSEKIEELLPSETIRVTLQIQKDGSREIAIEGAVL
ncbi:MAG: tRNA (adenosine(37)-N6)-threonylcarbamoyltransferase complex ATPase subunit type 1 TsaE [Sphaerochaetaceae bacterium]|nr:tRNA (adenosine(37)-N6)-threonylcarbamoyltransferase complex ATPase subunit type 1 TsaE [Sphaerochaetaceae bacterium]MDD4219286.1 tRNA (adenosine(37)-N6)-threonylcarbamoyltransferase complex ATPase subunit type 1 TsaE [Sphaerochaetaceae bacterium]